MARKIGEEIGIDVTSIRYLASQPWLSPGRS
jgi:NADH pyrophosphatase NudC (nudix superfamily)